MVGGSRGLEVREESLTASWLGRSASFTLSCFGCRSSLQSGPRAHQDRHPSPSQHWRGDSMCWIHGSLYRVSANKLSRTVASSPAMHRTGNVMEELLLRKQTHR